MIRDDGEEGEVCEHDGSYILIGDTETPVTVRVDMNIYSFHVEIFNFFQTKQTKYHV